MQSKTSFFNRGIMSKNLRRVTALSIIYFLIEFIALPVQYMIYLSPKGGYGAEYTRTYYMYECCSNDDMYAYIACVVVACSMLSIFSYMFNKRDTYMIHAFPVSRKALYTTGIMSSLIATVTPVLLVAVTTNVVAVTTGVADTIGVIWYWAFTNIAVTVLFTGLLALCIMFTGQLVTALAFYVILNFVALGIDVVLKLAMMVLNFGMSNVLNNIEFTCLTPLTFMENCGVSYTLQWDETYSKIEKMAISFDEPLTLTAYLFVGIIFIVAAYFIYKDKKLETVHDFISFAPIKPIFLVGMSFFTSVGIAVLLEQIFDATVVESHSLACVLLFIFTALIGVIIFLIIQMLIEKTSRVFTKKILTKCGIYTVCALIVLIGIKLDIPGVEKRVPTADEIEWVGVQTNYTYVFKEAGEIELARDLHKKIIDNKNLIINMSYNEKTDGETITFKYKLKNGKFVFRNYYLESLNNVSDERYSSLMGDIELALNNPTIIKEHVIGEYYADVEINSVNFTKVIFDKDLNTYSTEEVDPKFANADEKQKAYNKIYSALLQDIDDGALCQYDAYHDSNNYYNDFSISMKTKEKYISDETLFYGWQEYGEDLHNFYFNLNPNCVHIISALEETGFITKESDLVTYRTVEATYEDSNKALEMEID